MSVPTGVAEYLDRLSQDDARTELLRCCHSPRWADRMVSERPFENDEVLHDLADRIWEDLDSEDWLEALAAHPAIGARRIARSAPAETAGWARAEQSGVQRAPAEVLTAIEEGNRRYRDRFGFGFVICATGRSAPEILEQLQSRLQNDRDTEIRTAAAEQRQITRLRLNKLVSP